MGIEFGDEFGMNQDPPTNSEEDIGLGIKAIAYGFNGGIIAPREEKQKTSSEAPKPRPPKNKN
jgi:hypothetical protein